LARIKEYVLCKTPTPGKQSISIEKWKYELIRENLLRLLMFEKDGIYFNELPHLIVKQLSINDRRRLGSIPWYTTTVKLDLETKGEIERIPHAVPQKLRYKKRLNSA
jgi:hypothetical protein